MVNDALSKTTGTYHLRKKGRSEPKIEKGEKRMGEQVNRRDSNRSKADGGRRQIRVQIGRKRHLHCTKDFKTLKKESEDPRGKARGRPKGSSTKKPPLKTLGR